MRHWLFLCLFFLIGCGVDVDPSAEIPPTSDQSDFDGVVETVAVSATPSPPSATDVPTLATASDPTTQTEIFDEVVHLVRDYYRDENTNGVDWIAVSDNYRTRLTDGMSEDAFHQLLTDLVRELDDGHSFIMSPLDVIGAREVRRGNAGNAGLGITTLPRPLRGEALVAWAVSGNAAANAGIRAGDVILRVDGESLCCDVQGELNDYLLQGDEGETAEIVVRTGDQEPRTVTVTFRPIRVTKSVFSERVGDIGIISINSFLPRNVYTEFETAWRELSADGDLRGLIVDVRPNTGGSEREMRQSAELFSDGVVGHFVSRYSELPFTLTGRDVNGSQTIPLVILIGETTNSNGEIFAGLLQEAGRATLIGQPTNGNIETILSYNLADGGQLWLAKDRFYPPSGTNWDGNGVQPDIVVDQAWSAIGDDADLTRQAALEHFGAGR